jgi:hypothetical protein
MSTTTGRQKGETNYKACLKNQINCLINNNNTNSLTSYYNINFLNNFYYQQYKIKQKVVILKSKELIYLLAVQKHSIFYNFNSKSIYFILLFSFFYSFIKIIRMKYNNKYNNCLKLN